MQLTTKIKDRKKKKKNVKKDRCSRVGRRIHEFARVLRAMLKRQQHRYCSNAEHSLDVAVELFFRYWTAQNGRRGDG